MTKDPNGSTLASVQMRSLHRRWSSELPSGCAPHPLLRQKAAEVHQLCEQKQQSATQLTFLSQYHAFTGFSAISSGPMTGA